MSILHNVHSSTFLGIKMLQQWADLPLWEKFLNENSDIRTIIELGTYTGAFSIFLLLQSLQRGIDFYTFDDKKRDALDGPVARQINLRRYFHLGDIFKDSKQAVITAFNHRPTLLYCDNGYKYKEVITFFTYFQPGDYLVIHDWGVEFTELNIKPFQDKLEPLLWDECEELNSLTRFWRVKSV